MALPPIGSPERDRLEKEAIDYGLERLAVREDIEDALADVRSAFGAELADHAGQCWITAIMQGFGR